MVFYAELCQLYLQIKRMSLAYLSDSYLLENGMRTTQQYIIHPLHESCLTRLSFW
jgi:hypothetical protein